MIELTWLAVRVQSCENKAQDKYSHLATIKPVSPSGQHPSGMNTVLNELSYSQLYI